MRTSSVVTVLLVCALIANFAVVNRFTKVIVHVSRVLRDLGTSLFGLQISVTVICVCVCVCASIENYIVAITG